MSTESESNQENGFQAAKIRDNEKANDAAEKSREKLIPDSPSNGKKSTKKEENHNKTANNSKQYEGEYEIGDWLIERMFSDEESKPLTFVSVYAGNLPDPKIASDCLKFTGAVYPLGELNHLKRIKKDFATGQLSMIICEKSKATLEEIKASLEEKKLNLNLYETMVSKFAPITRRQYDEWNVYWPSSYYDSLKNKILSPKELVEIVNRMATVIARQEEAVKNNQPSEVSMLVDSNGKILAESFDQRHLHPLKHSVICCIDNISLFQQASTPSSSAASSKNRKRNISEISEISETDSTMPHLCNGLDLYTNIEPCVMCAMALVHSRIGRVFYLNKDPDFGGLGGRYKIHTQPGVNHHFDVFQLRKKS